jgi:hypothetical protein
VSRRIVQLLVSSIANELTGETWDHVYALDNNGVAWLLRSPDAPRWERLPPLPSVENLAPRQRGYSSAESQLAESSNTAAE